MDGPSEQVTATFVKAAEDAHTAAVRARTAAAAAPKHRVKQAQAAEADARKKLARTKLYAHERFWKDGIRSGCMDLVKKIGEEEDALKAAQANTEKVMQEKAQAKSRKLSSEFIIKNHQRGCHAKVIGLLRVPQRNDPDRMDTIKKAWHKTLRMWHPDRVLWKEIDAKECVEEATYYINASYKFLKDYLE